MTTNRVSVCHPQPCLPCHPCLLLTWYTKQIFGHYLSEKQTPRKIVLFKKVSKGACGKGKEMFLAMCDVCLCHCWGPFSSVSPARLACHLSPLSHIVLRQPLQSGQKKGKGGSFNQYFRNQKPPQLVLCWANNNSFISFPMIRNSSLSVAIYFWL